MRFLFKIDLSCLQVGSFFGRQNKNSILLLRGVAIFVSQKTFFNTLSVLWTFFHDFYTSHFFNTLSVLRTCFGPSLASYLGLCLAFLCCLLLCSFAFLSHMVFSDHLRGAQASSSRFLFVTYGLVEADIMYFDI